MIVNIFNKHCRRKGEKNGAYLHAELKKCNVINSGIYTLTVGNDKKDKREEVEFTIVAITDNHSKFQVNKTDKDLLIIQKICPIGEKMFEDIDILTTRVGEGIIYSSSDIYNNIDKSSNRLPEKPILGVNIKGNFSC